MYDEDSAILNKLKKYNTKRKKSFNTLINRKELTDEELDDLFL